MTKVLLEDLSFLERIACATDEELYEYAAVVGQTAQYVRERRDEIRREIMKRSSGSRFLH